MHRVYHVQVRLDDNIERPARLVRAGTRAQAERHVMKGCLVTHVATQDEIIKGIKAHGDVEVAGEEVGELDEK
jgi:hypothetical protein